MSGNPKCCVGISARMTRHTAFTPRVRMLLFWLSWLVGTAACGLLAAVGLYMSVWMIPAVGMKNDPWDWVGLALIFGAGPLSAICVLASLFLGLRRRYHYGLAVFFLPAIAGLLLAMLLS